MQKSLYPASILPSEQSESPVDVTVVHATGVSSPDAIILDPDQLPSWQRPFVLKPNVRFTRTPGRSVRTLEPAPVPLAGPDLGLSIPPVEPWSEPQAEVPALVDQASGPRHANPSPEPASLIVGSPVSLLQMRLATSLQGRTAALTMAAGQARAATSTRPMPSVPTQPAGRRDDAKLSEAAQVYVTGGALDAAPPVTVRQDLAPSKRAFPAMPDHLLWEMISLGLSDAEEAPSEVVTAKRQPAASVTTKAERLLQENPTPQPPSCDVPAVLAPEVIAPEILPPADGGEETGRSAVHLYRQVALRTVTVQATASAPAEPMAAPPASVASTSRPAEDVQSFRRSARRTALGLTPTSIRASDDYLFPSVDLLQSPGLRQSQDMSQEALEQSAGLLESVLEDFGVKGEIIDVRPGPVVTLYEFAPAPGVKSSRIINLSDDIARSMSALSARVAVVPGRNVIGIELPNQVRDTVYLRELIESSNYVATDYRLPVCLGKTIGGEAVIAELAKMPHLLVAGTTGSGKSVAINTMILSLIYHLSPDECRLIMVDPKMLELSVYDGIPHLLTPVVTDSKKAVLALKWAVREMEERYRKMSRLGVRNIDGFNSRVGEARSKGETILVSVPCGFDKGTGEPLFEDQELDLSPLPFIVIIVDEMADLMMVAGKEIEGAIQRLAQMARAAGIHLIMATQRPSVDVITGTIKANFPTRISFQVTSKIDSRTILGEQGAEHLLGQGDMLHMTGGGRIARVHGPFVSDYEVEKVVAHLKAQGQPAYLGGVTEDEEGSSEEGDDVAVFDQSSMAGEGGADELYERAVQIVQRDKKCSTSYIQRRLSVGYNRAASLVERMEQEGLVGPPNHVGKREILSSKAQIQVEQDG
jgi:S-DNA-T family DNA segregation ATPase FtsK/SpoIIIE